MESNGSYEILPILFTSLVDFPDNKTDCGITILNNETQLKCFYIEHLARFYFGGDLSSNGSPGHVVCFLIWVLVTLIGGLGSVGNNLIISILRKREKCTAFDFLLSVLAWCDFLCCVSATVKVTATIVYYGKP